MSVDSFRPPTISHLSYGMFTDCRRRWLYRYCCDHLPYPSQTVWEIKRQTKLVPWATFSGKVVDHVISLALNEFRSTQTWPADLHCLAKDAASYWYRFSQHWLREVRTIGARWPEHPDFQPLDVHFYDVPPPVEEINAVRDKYRQCLDGYLSSPIRAKIEASDPARWRGPRQEGEDLPRFVLDGVTVYAVYDFAIQDDGLLSIYDWKTGDLTAQSEARVLDQLHWYALYAIEAWQVPIESIRLVPVWLANLGIANQVEVDDKAIERLRSRIKQRYLEIYQLLHLDEGGAIDLAEWPVTEKHWLCDTCQFRGTCEGAQRKSAEADPGGIDPFRDAHGEIQ